MRVLLTGATGFIGREIVRPLMASGAEVHTLGRRDPGVTGVTHHSLDLLGAVDYAAVGDIGATHLVHLAWHPERNFWTAPENLDWVAASLRLVRAFAAGGGRRAVVAGSCAEYAPCHERLAEGTSPIAPATLYGTAKASLHALLASAAPGLGLSLAWPRIFFPYGPLERPQRLLGTLLDALRHNEVARFSIGTQRRDFIHVEDAAAAIVAILARPIEGAVNVASGSAVTVRRFVEVAAAAADMTDRVAFSTASLPASEPPVIEGAVERLAGIGFRPRFTLADGLADAVARFRGSPP
ncbi:MAG TPA: NAD(P)-dependent oxidoreductase [Xanthobacteraceae bacterium]|nr:NAD(P)-dependent oxidoreductase [Xanthobacteraceae bacterium]